MQRDATSRVRKRIQPHELLRRDDFDGDAWEDLLNFIEENQVIPIIGPELVVVQTESGPENLTP